MDVEECRRRFAGAPRAVLATLGADGAPHLVPVTFALVGPDRDEIAVAVDHKPKRTRDLRRVRNARADPRVSFLVDSWADGWGEEWSRLWWVRADARAAVLDDPADPRAVAALDALVARYPQYATRRPGPPVILAEVTRWVGWRA